MTTKSSTALKELGNIIESAFNLIRILVRLQSVGDNSPEKYKKEAFGSSCRPYWITERRVRTSGAKRNVGALTVGADK